MALLYIWLQFYLFSFWLVPLALLWEKWYYDHDLLQFLLLFPYVFRQECDKS